MAGQVRGILPPPRCGRRIDRQVILRIRRLREILIVLVTPRPADQMEMKAIPIRHREVRLILALGPSRATDLRSADQDSRRPMKVPAALPTVPDLVDLPEDRHPKWTEFPALALDLEARPVVQKKDPVPVVRPSVRCSNRNSWYLTAPPVSSANRDSVIRETASSRHAGARSSGRGGVRGIRWRR